jgi:hypothetical protein
MNKRMSKLGLIRELRQLNVEIGRLEQRIADGEGGITEHILLVATRRTHATIEQALHMSGETLPLYSRASQSCA